MDTLEFKSWLEDATQDAQKEIERDPRLSALQKKTQAVAMDAVNQNKDATKEVQKVVAKENIPTNQMSLMMPKTLTPKMMKKK
jgi:hypothetical protein